MALKRIAPKHCAGAPPCVEDPLRDPPGEPKVAVALQVAEREEPVAVVVEAAEGAEEDVEVLVRKVAALGVDVVGGVAARVERAEGGEERRGAQGAAADGAGAQRVEGIEDAKDGGLGVPLQEAGGIAKKREGGVALGDGFSDVKELGGAHRRAVVGRREAGEQPRLGGDAGEAPREKRLEAAGGGGALAAAGGAAGELRRAERRGEPSPEGAAEGGGQPAARQLRQQLGEVVEREAGAVR